MWAPMCVSASVAGKADNQGPEPVFLLIIAGSELSQKSLSFAVGTERALPQEAVKALCFGWALESDKMGFGSQLHNLPAMEPAKVTQSF